MNLMSQIKTSKKNGESFIANMRASGYVVHNVDGYVHFTKDGKTDPNYSVVFVEGKTFVGVRPHPQNTVSENNLVAENTRLREALVRADKAMAN